jgi:hypothetical protein
MDELIERLTLRVGIHIAIAEKDIGIIPAFLRKEKAADKIETPIDKIPDTETSGGISGTPRSRGEPSAGHWIVPGSRLTGPGSGMSEIQGTIRELFKVGRDITGADQMGTIIAGTPALSRLA